jgi:hypothetical protein
MNPLYDHYYESQYTPQQTLYNTYQPQYNHVINYNHQQSTYTPQYFQYPDPRTYVHRNLPKFEIDTSSVDICTIDKFLSGENKTPVAIPEIEICANKSPMKSTRMNEVVNSIQNSPEKQHEKKEETKRTLESTNNIEMKNTDTIQVIPVRRGKKMLEIKMGTSFNTIRQISFHDVEDNNKELFESILRVHPLSASVTESNGKYSLDINQIPMTIHQEFAVIRNGIRLGKCSQRFKLSGRKFNYKRDDNGEKIKMIGDYNRNFVAKRNATIIAKLWDDHSSGLKLEVNARDSDLEHILCLVTIVLLNKYASLVRK